MRFRIKNWIHTLIRGENSCWIDRAAQRTTQMTIRPMTRGDEDACLDIYRGNEPNRFPNGYDEIYKQYLRDAKALVLVAEKDSKIVATGGIALHRASVQTVSMLSYGMVSPTCQRQGIGTTLLLARLSLLPQTKANWVVCMTSVGGSDSFYRRYGFTYVTDVNGELSFRFPLFKLMLHRDELVRIGAVLAERNVNVCCGGARIPTIDPPEG